MSEKCVREKLTHPHKISLYNNGKNPNIYYYFRWKKKVFQGSTGFDNLDAAINKVSEIFYKVSKGIREKGRVKTVKFEDVVKKFLKYKEDQTIASHTMRDYNRQSKYLIEYNKDRDIGALCNKREFINYREWRNKYYQTHEKKQVQKYKRNGRSVTGKKYSTVGNITINRECRLLVSILRFAKEYMNILNNIQIPSYKMLPEKRRDEILTREEYSALKEYWMQKNPYYWDIISFVNNTGIRYPSELNKIRWKDVYLPKSYVMIRDRKNKDRTQPLNTPVPLIGKANEIIERLKAREGIAIGPDDYVFVNDDGVRIASISKAFKKSLLACQIEKNLTMYSLRHLFTTRMVRRPDIPIKVLAEVLGHKDTTMINKVYSQLRAKDLVNVFQRSEDHKQEEIKKQQEKEKNGQ